MNRIDKLFRGQFLKSSWDSIFLKNLTLDTDDAVLKRPYKKSDLVFICISTTARAISQVPLKCMEKTRAGIWEWMGDRDPVQQLLSKPNVLTDSTEEFIGAIVSHLMLDGHIFIVPFPPTGKYFDSLWPVKKENMGVSLDSRTGQINYWEYKPNNNMSIPLLPDEIGSIKFFNPYDTIWGFAPLDAGRLPVMNDYKAANYTAKFWDQGAVPGGVLQTDKNLTEDRVERIKKHFLSDHESYKKAHRVAVLEGGLKYQQIGLSQKDMEFIDLRKFNRDNILQIYGMKKAVISVTEDLNYATAKEERKEWWQDTNMPLMKLIEASLSNILYPNNPDFKVVFDISGVEALHEDYTKRVEIGEILMKIGFTANEINERLELGFHPKSWRDKWYMPVNFVPVTEAGVERPPVPPVNPTLPGSHNPPALPAPKGIEYVTIIDTKAVEEDRQKEFDQIWKTVIGKSENLELEFLSKIRRCFFDMRKKTLKILNQKALDKSIDDLMTEEFLAEKQNLMKWTVPIYERGTRTGAQTLANEIGTGVSFNINDPQILHFITERPIKVVRVVDTVKDMIRSEIHAGMEVNETINQIAGRIKNTFARSQQRAMTIARTEVGSSVNFGRSQQLAQAGYTKKIWVTAGDERVRVSHQFMNGQSTEVGKPWIVDGSSLRYPGDPAGAGYTVINCFTHPLTPIFTDKGWLPIKDIKIGMSVLTHAGKFKKVIKTNMGRPFKGELIKIIPKHRKDNSVTVTPEHRFLINGNWKEAKDIKDGDKISILGSFCTRCQKIIPYWNKYCSKSCSSKDITDRQWGSCEHHLNMSNKVSKKNLEQYANGERDKFKTVEKARNNLFAKYGKGGFLGKERKTEEFQELINKGIDKKYGSRLEMLKVGAFSAMGKASWEGSSLERQMEKILTEQGREYQQQFWVGKRRTDFYCADEKLFIECDSVAHHSDKEKERKRDLEILMQYPDHRIAHAWFENKTIDWSYFDLAQLNHTGTYDFIDVEINTERVIRIKPFIRLFNFAVEGDESYIARGFVSHNCRCLEVADLKSAQVQEVPRNLPPDNENKFVSGKIIKIQKREEKSFNKTFLVDIEDDGQGILKFIKDEKKHWDNLDLSKATMSKREVVVSEIDKLLGTTLVPKTVFKTVTNDISPTIKGKGSCQIFMNDFNNAYTLSDKSLLSSILSEVGERELQKGSAFDLIIGSDDRHPGNWGFNKNKLVFIDNGISLGKQTDIYGIKIHQNFLEYNLNQIKPFIIESGAASNVDRVGEVIELLKKTDNEFTRTVKKAKDNLFEIKNILQNNNFSEKEVDALEKRVNALFKDSVFDKGE